LDFVQLGPLPLLLHYVVLIANVVFVDVVVVDVIIGQVVEHVGVVVDSIMI